MRSYPLYNVFIFCAGLGLASGTASAAAFSFQGTFATDDQKEIFSFVAGPGGAVLRTWGYAGGTNANGDNVSSGGFDPILSLFGPGLLLQASTPLLASVNDGASVAIDPSTGAGFDSFIDTAGTPAIALIPGETYFVVLTESDNSPLGVPSGTFGDGFSEEGQGNFTGALYGCGSGQFCDLNSNQRDGHWAVDITGVDSVQNLTATPEPGSFWLFGCAGALATVVRRRFSTTRRAS